MKQEYIAQGKTIDEAIEEAAVQLGVDRDELSIEILETPSKGFWGFGSSPAKIKASYGTDELPAEQQAREYLERLCEIMDLKDVKIQIDISGKNMHINMTGPHLGALIGKRGETMYAVQYLLSLAMFKHKMLSFVISSFFSGVGGALFAMYVANAQAKVFTSTMTYEILLIVVIGGIGSVSGSVIGTFLYVACSEWWLRFLDRETYIGSFKVPLLRSGFRMVVFSVVIMIIVLFFSKGIMGEKELSWKGIGGLLKKRKKAAPAAEKED